MDTPSFMSVNLYTRFPELQLYVHRLTVDDPETPRPGFIYDYVRRGSESGR